MIKAKKRKILLLPGDGIGPEVTGEVKKIINWFNDKKSLDLVTPQFHEKSLNLYHKIRFPMANRILIKSIRELRMNL